MWVLFSKEQSFYSYFFKSQLPSAVHRPDLRASGDWRPSTKPQGQTGPPKSKLPCPASAFPWALWAKTVSASTDVHPHFLASVGQTVPLLLSAWMQFQYRRTLLNASCTYTPRITPTNFLVPVLLFPVLQGPNASPESFPNPSVLTLVLIRFLSIVSSWGNPSPSLLTGTKMCLKKPLLLQATSLFFYPHLFVKVSPSPKVPFQHHLLPPGSFCVVQLLRFLPF